LVDKEETAPVSAPTLTATLHRLLLVEDDDGDALLVSEYLADASSVIGPVELIRARTLAAAVDLLSSNSDVYDCVLVDLGLPDTQGLAGLRSLRRAAPDVAHVVLTGLDDVRQGVAALAVGAQDYLVKGQVDGDLLARSLRYAITRRKAEQQLAEERSRTAENARLERGLLPRPVLRTTAVGLDRGYRPGRGSVLGGDFYDVVEGDDGIVRAILGDISGHGPDEAALGVLLRVAWRTLVLAGTPDEKLLPGVEQILLEERWSDEVFATVAMIALDRAERDHRYGARLWLAGHPGPLVSALGEPVRVVHAPDPQPALGLIPGWEWDALEIPLGVGWHLLVFTDGLVEGRRTDGGRLGEDGLVGLFAEHGWLRTPGPLSISAVIDAAVAENGGPLVDDVAMLHLWSRETDA
jgi:serine phosphatase RsbU (regulator of sigma subunit)